ncbi:MAG: hypothetical protein AB2A00_39725 [Myxococcota bacterium]
MKPRSCLALLVVLLSACRDGVSTTDAGALDEEPTAPVPIPAEPQRPGDPAAGYDALINRPYVSCGVPYTAYARAYGPAPLADRIPGRNALNEEMPYDNTSFIAPSGVRLVTANCLLCHAARINGELVVGLGNSALDFTADRSVPAELAGGLITDETERAEWRRWADRMQFTAPYLVTRTVGANPADALAAIIFAHRVPETLAWSDELLTEPPPLEPVITDVPPWWGMRKKNAMFYMGFGRGDHARLMMSASSLCTDTVEEARAIDAYFNDVRAYIASLTPPPHPFQIDEERAAQGRELFERTCSRCHGTYGEGGQYPNLMVPQSVVGTDALLVEKSRGPGRDFAARFNRSFWGEAARIVVSNGYVAPPLDGIWATAPYLHNGSVPTLAALLESGTRPVYWRRTFVNTDYDPVDVGWRHTVLDHGQDEEPDDAQRRTIYDTTLPGHSNMGHTFGDAFSAEERLAVIEYLKTL